VHRVCVVGAGIVGLAVARQLTLTFPGVEVVVLDKEPDVARHQTGHNSGVVHAGLYYPPASLKATLCRRGMAQLREYAANKGIPYQEVGKLVVAIDDDEVAALAEIERRARTNEVPGLRRLDPAAMRELEPNVAGVAALHSPRTAITDFPAVTRSFADDVAAAGGRVELSSEVTGIVRERDRVRVTTPRGGVVADHVVVCAGLQSDRVAAMAGDGAEPAVVPFRGEYLDLVPDRRNLVSGLIYPVPDPSYPFLGVHFTRRVDGSLDIGPNAVLAFAREGYRRRDVRWADLSEVMRWPGFRRLAREHWRMGLTEMAGSASRQLFVRRAQRYVPQLQPSDVVPAAAGVRAQALDKDGSLVDDFRIHHLGSVTAVRNAPSPAATSSMAIGEFVVAQMSDHLVPRSPAPPKAGAPATPKAGA
jgi:L-2-hydroxyglutarate oxidase LhgO